MFNRLKLLFKIIKRMIHYMGLPQGWLSVKSFTVIVQIASPDISIARNNLQKALLVRDEVILLCHDIQYDKLYHAIKYDIDNENLSKEALQYAEQADKNYLEMVTSTMEIVIFYSGNFYELHLSERNKLRELCEGEIGCSLVDNLMGIGYNRHYIIFEHTVISQKIAKKIAKKLVCA